MLCPLFCSELPHSEFEDDPNPYEGIPSLHDYLDDDLDYPKPMNLHPPRSR